MTDAVMKPTAVSIEDFLLTVTEQRARESRILIESMYRITGEPAVMWGASIIGFGNSHYTYASGREGDMPILGFSPRKTALTVYFMEGFDKLYVEQLSRLGPHKTSKSCLYITKLNVIDMAVLVEMLEATYSVYRGHVR